MMSPSSTVDARENATFVFEGEVVEVGASTEPSYPPGGPPVIVRVERVLLSGAPMANRGGSVMTVELGPGEEVRAGERYEFFTLPRLFANTIVVTSLGHGPAGGPEADAAAADPVEAYARRELRKHVPEVDLIVVGQVTAVRLTNVDKWQPTNRKDPELREADIAVSEVLAGTPPARAKRREAKVVVLFSGSPHRAWSDAPKLEVGQQSMFLLHSIVPEPGSDAHYICIHPTDMQPLSRAADVRGQV